MVKEIYDEFYAIQDHANDKMRDLGEEKLNTIIISAKLLAVINIAVLEANLESARAAFKNVFEEEDPPAEDPPIY